MTAPSFTIVACPNCGAPFEPSKTTGGLRVQFCPACQRDFADAFPDDLDWVEAP